VYCEYKVSCKYNYHKKHNNIIHISINTPVYKKGTVWQRV